MDEKTTHWLISIDPATTSGWALFQGSLLVGCGFTRNKEVLSAAQIFDLSGFGIHPFKEGFAVVIEEPEWSRDRKSSPTAILKVSFIAGCWRGLVGLFAKRVTLVPPSKWKHSIPKKIHHPRIMKGLSPSERELFEKSETTGDTIDAIGLGQWHIKQGSK